MSKILCRIFHAKHLIEYTAKSFTDTVSGKKVRSYHCVKCSSEFMTDGGIFGFRSYKKKVNK